MSRTLLYGLLWWVLTDGAASWDAFAIGVPAVALAAFSSTVLLPRIHLSWLGLLRFAGFFLWESWRGAIDVSRRALHPRMPLAPDVIRHELGVVPDISRVAVTNTGSLVPGTLSIDLEGRSLYMHLLDGRERDPDENIVVATERRVAAMLR